MLYRSALSLQKKSKFNQEAAILERLDNMCNDIEHFRHSGAFSPPQMMGACRQFRQFEEELEDYFVGEKWKKKTEEEIKQEFCHETTRVCQLSKDYLEKVKTKRLNEQFF